MTRNRFGGSAADWLLGFEGDNVVKPPADYLEVTYWSGPPSSPGRTQYSDLQLLNGTPVTEITAAADGQIPEHFGPDDVEVTRMWASATAGTTGVWVTTSTFDAVGFSGVYADLSGKPAIPSTAAEVGAETPAGAQAKADAAAAASVPLTQKGAASGVAPLDAGSRVAEANLPAGLAASALSATFARRLAAHMEAGRAKFWTDQRLRDTVMVTPPTYTQFGVGVSTGIITSQRQYKTPTVSGQVISFAVDTGKTNPSGAQPAQMRMIGGVPNVFTQSSTVYASSGINRDGSNNLIATEAPYRVEIGHYGSKFAIALRGGSSGYFRLKVDGVYTSLTPTTSTADSGFHFHLFDFGTAAPRHLEFEISLLAIGFIQTGPTDITWLPPRRRALRVMYVGDSFAGGTLISVESRAFTGMAQRFGERFGEVEMYVDGIGSTGYLASATTYRTRLALNLTKFTPDLIVIQGSVNDSGQTQAAVQAEAALTFATCATLAPGVPVMVTFGASSNPVPAGQATAFAGVVAAAAAAPNVIGVHDWSTILDGTGTAGAPAGTGSSDVLRSTDGTHPTQAGHDVVGRLQADWLFQRLAGLNPTLVG